MNYLLFIQTVNFFNFSENTCLQKIALNLSKNQALSNRKKIINDPVNGFITVPFPICLDIIDSHLVFCIDSLALVAASLVLLLTSFALYFGVEYMYREAFINRLLYLLNLFATSVVFLFFCYDYFLILFSMEWIFHR